MESTDKLFGVKPGDLLASGREDDESIVISKVARVTNNYAFLEHETKIRIRNGAQADSTRFPKYWHLVTEEDKKCVLRRRLTNYLKAIDWKNKDLSDEFLKQVKALYEAEIAKNQEKAE
jgi:hypothetical protein